MSNPRPSESLYVRRSLPFCPSSNQVIYIEERYHPRVNKFIQDNYKSLCTDMARYGFEFCYIPALVEELSTEQFVRYFTPYKSEFSSELKFDSTFLNEYAKRGSDLHPSFIVHACDEDTSRHYVFDVLRVKGPGFGEAFKRFLQEQRRKLDKWQSDIRYCETPFIEVGEDNEDYADSHFSEEVDELMKDVRDRVDLLRRKGVSEMVLRSLLCPEIKLSRLQITSTYRILLPDYDNREIKMTPLVKAVFLLFLRHPEGIVFKFLPDYRLELLGIYSRLTGRVDNGSIHQSIMDVTSPYKNSINEKCARIREAFVREFDDRLAEYYYVTGNRGGAKSIRLPRNLIMWERI